MGEPGPCHDGSSATEYIGCRSERGELKHLSTLRKRKRQERLLRQQLPGESRNHPDQLFGKGRWCIMLFSARELCLSEDITCREAAGPRLILLAPRIRREILILRNGLRDDAP